MSPKVGAILSPFSGTELYANAGTGFHSNDARGAVIAVDPISGEPTLEGFNLFDAEVSDIDYFYVSRLTDEPEEVEDIHLHPAPPFTARFGVQFSF